MQQRGQVEVGHITHIPSDVSVPPPTTRLLLIIPNKALASGSRPSKDEDELSDLLDATRLYLDIEDRAEHLLAQIELVRSRWERSCAIISSVVFPDLFLAISGHSRPLWVIFKPF